MTSAPSRGRALRGRRVGCAELAPGEREDLGHEPVEPGVGERAGVRRGEAVAKQLLAAAVEQRQVELRLQAPELGDEPEALVDGGDDADVVLADEPSDLVEPGARGVVAQVPTPVTPATSAIPLKTPCNTIGG